MKDEEVVAHINKYYNERMCMKCAVWDAAAKEYGKRGICEECFNRNCVLVETTEVESPQPPQLRKEEE